MTAFQFDILQTLAAYLVAFATDPRTILIAVFILLDLGTGIMAALRTGTFDWALLAQFYRTNVLPYLLGYGLLYVLSGTIAALLQNSDPQLRPFLAVLGTLVEQISQYGGFGAILLALGTSIARNLSEIQTRQPVGARPIAG